MGVLDDAIREHLELKRRRGADPGELKRDENEALGAVPGTASRRDQEPESAAAPEPEAEVTEEPEDPAAQFIPPPLNLGQPDAGAQSSQASDPIVQQPTEAFDSSELADALGDETASAEAADTPPEIEVAQAEQPEAEEGGRSDQGEASDAQAKAGDALEETPEFMEESPEHDKLWFEQKPPKDFDF